MVLTAMHYLNPAKRPPRRSGLADKRRRCQPRSRGRRWANWS